MRIGRSVITRGRSVEEALEKAGLLLSVPRESLAYELLEDKNSVPGFYKLKAVCIAPPPAESSTQDPVANLDRFDAPWSEQDVAALPREQFIRELNRASYDHTELVPVDDAPPAEPEEVALEIDHDIGAANGSIDHMGDLIIHGNITFGANIRATGNVLIEGDIESAFVDCFKHLSVKGGILGTVRSREGGISCHYAHAAYIVAAQRISIAESAIHSQMIAGVEIDVGDAIVGGHSYARNILWARSAGSETGVPTSLATGQNRYLRDQLEDIRKQATKLTELLANCNSTIQTLEPVEREGEALSGELRVQLWRAVSRKARLRNLALILSDERARLIKLIDRERTARIKIRDRLYPNTTIEIDDGGIEIRALTHFATFSKDYETGKIRMTPYS